MALAEAPDLDHASTALKRAEDEEAYWSSHWSELLNRHAERFVAIIPDDGNLVIVAATDLQELIRTVTEKGLDPQQVWIRFVTKDPRRLLL